MSRLLNKYGDSRGVYSDFGGKPESKSLLENPALDGSVILYRIFRKWNGENELD